MSELEEQSALATARAKGTEEGLKQGKEEGMKQGKEEGKKEKEREIAKRMLKKGISIEKIMELTELSKKEIEKLK